MINRSRDSGQWIGIQGEETIPFDLKDVDWNFLTKSEDKINIFSLDPEFRLVYNLFKDEIINLSTNYSLVLFKPECFTNKNAFTNCINILNSKFVIVDYKFFVFNNNISSLLWRYQLNRATLDRLRLLFVFQNNLPGLVLIVKKRENDNIPCSIMLSNLKGSGFKKNYDPSKLRSQFTPENPMINFVHASDEPADFIRELGVLFSYTELNSFHLDKEVKIDNIMEEVHSLHSDIDFDLSDYKFTLNKLITSLDLSKKDHQNFLNYINDLSEFKEYADFDKFFNLLNKCQISYNFHEVLYIFSRHMIRTHDHMKEMVGKVDNSKWV